MYHVQAEPVPVVVLAGCSLPLTRREHLDCRHLPWTRFGLCPSSLQSPICNNVVGTAEVSKLADVCEHVPTFSGCGKKKALKD